MESIQATVEQACLGLSDPHLRKQAEAALLEFRRSPNPVHACQYILEHSGSLPARFQAAVTLREAAVRQWGVTSAEEKRQLRSYILHFILRHEHAAGDVIISQLTAAVASMLKRDWLESSKDERHAFFAETEDMASQQGSPATRRASIRVLEGVVTEFSPATASPLGLPWDYHERCRASLEADYLQSFFIHATSIARGSAPAAVEGRDEGVCQACVSLLCAILSWDFRQGSSSIPVYGDGRPCMTGMLVKPQPTWRDILLSPEAVDWLIALLKALQGRPDSALAAASRQLLVLFCSISGDIFPKEAEQKRADLGLQHSIDAKEAYLQRLLAAVIPSITPPEAVLHKAAANNEGELLDACRALAVLAQVHRASGFGRVRVNKTNGSGGVLFDIANITRACISAGGLSEAAEGTWTAEVTNLLLDTWVELLYDHVMLLKWLDEGPSKAEAEAAATVFQALTEGALKDAAECAHLDEEEGEAADDAGVGAMAGREDWFARAAAVGRASAAFSADLLSARIQRTQQHLLHCASTGQDPAEPLEELHWLTRMAAHLLADSGEGETPMVPVSVAAAAAAAQPGRDPIEGLSHALLGVAGLCLDERARPVVSPRLMEAAASGTARWADTYLMASEPASAGLGAAFGLQGGGPAVLQALVQVANILLSQFPGEVDLHRVVAARLLPVLTQQATTCRCLAHVEAWRALVQAFAEQAAPIRALAGPTVRALAKALTVAAGGLPDQASACQYITHLMHTITEEVSSIAARPDLAAIAERPDLMARVGYLLEALRGSARGTCPKAQPALFSVASAIMTPLVSLQKVYHNQPSVSCQLLKLAADVVEAQISFVQVSDAKVLCEWVLHLLQQYSAYNLGQVSIAAAARLRAEAAADSYREVRALIRLLTLLNNRDLVDFGGAQNSSEAQVNIAQVLFLGLEIVIPLVTGELLQFPKLVRSFFSLVSYMMEIYPEHVASLPESQMRVVLSTLEFGINATDVEVVQGSLEALAALAKFHHSALASGAAGIAAAQGGSLLGGFLELIVRRLLLEDLGKDTLELAADALFPLVLSHMSAFQSLGEKLLASQQDTAAQSALVRAMNELLTTNGIENTVDRIYKRRFRANLTKFVVEARSIVRLR
ncbi:probable Exportin-4 [Coccomyxa sp. Obi]|nr:probable Exportin-4 [Coccomyxa sp. Obi]